LANIPFTINSAYRSPEQNARVGGKPNSSHLRGLAVDIRVNDSSTRYIVLNALISVGFNRIGVEGSFIHVDDDKSKSDKVVWTY
jgi:zinc D-Ala-D-Ala carboxypeptidase